MRLFLEMFLFLELEENEDTRDEEKDRLHIILMRLAL
jgi:hypothetical protein